jgi:hypothetical protein
MAGRYIFFRGNFASLGLFAEFDDDILPTINLTISAKQSAHSATPIFMFFGVNDFSSRPNEIRKTPNLSEPFFIFLRLLAIFFWYGNWDVQRGA